MAAPLPTINLNGTSPIMLRDEYAAAYGAIDKAIEALAAATLNGRDFPQGWDAYYEARAERDQAFESLRQVQEYVGRILERVCDSM